MSQILEKPVKSVSDKNSYRLIKLQNGIKVLLIRHPKDMNNESNKKSSAVCLSIDVGGIDDGEVKGLSHFLEHMAFLGSTKYPSESEYYKFISNNGGSPNASTGFNETKYYFTVIEDKLEEAIDRFSSIFVDPLISESAVAREVEAVDSEFQNRKGNDLVRAAYLLRIFMNKDIANEFTSGNKSSLLDDGMRTSTELQRLVRSHFDKYYVANRMNLAVESSRKLDELQTIVEKYFNPIKSGVPREPLPIDIYKNIYSADFYNQIVYIKPLKDVKYIALSWFLPSTDKHYHIKPIDYISNLMSDQSSGGVINYLKKNLLITEMSSYESRSFGTNSMMSEFAIKIVPTKTGSENVEKILEAIYSYLLLIKTTPIEQHKEIYENYAIIRERKFTFQEPKKALSNVVTNSTNMKALKDIDILRGPYLYQEFDRDVIQNYIDLLNQPNFTLAVIDYESNVAYDQNEKIYGIDYKKEVRSEALQKVWAERKINPELTLPPKNKFISNNFDIISVRDNLESTKYPEKISHTDNVEVWYKLDSQFKVPIGHVNIILDCPFNYASNLNITATFLYIDIIKRFLDEELASAKTAGYTFTISMFYSNRLAVKLKGYNEKLQLFVEMVLMSMKKFNQFLDESVFNVYKKKFKDQVIRSLKSGNLFYILTDYLKISKIIIDYNKLMEVDNITYDFMKTHVDKCFGEMALKIQIQGNVSRDEAFAISNKIVAIFDAKPIKDPSSVDNKFFKFPLGRSSVKIKSFQNDDKNSYATDLYDLGSRSLRKDCIANLFTAILKEPTFNTLRTKEQLGYLVGLSVDRNDFSTGFKVYIRFQKEKHSPRSITERIQKYIKEDIKEFLEKLGDESFNQVKESQINLKNMIHDDLETEVQWNLYEIESTHYVFDRQKKEAEMIKTLTKQDVIDFYNTYVHSNDVRILNIEVLAHDDKIDENDLQMKFITEKFVNDENVITDMEKFKENLESY